MCRTGGFSAAVEGGMVTSVTCCGAWTKCLNFAYAEPPVLQRFAQSIKAANMTTTNKIRLVAIALLTFVPPVFAPGAWREPGSGRVCDPHPFVHGRTGLLHVSDFVASGWRAGILRPGLSDDVRLHQSRCRAFFQRGAAVGSGLCNLLLGEAWAWGSYPECPHVGRGIAAGFRSRARGAETSRQGNKRRS